MPEQAKQQLVILNLEDDFLIEEYIPPVGPEKLPNMTDGHSPSAVRFHGEDIVSVAHFSHQYGETAVEAVRAFVSHKRMQAQRAGWRCVARPVVQAMLDR